MRGWLERRFLQPLRESGGDYRRAVARHWLLLVAGILALIGTTQVIVPSLSLPYWGWLLISFGVLSWAQFLAFHDMRTDRNERAEEYRIGQDARRQLEKTAITLRQRVPQRDLIAQWDFELRVTELLYHRTQSPVHPYGIQDVRNQLQGMDHRARIYLKSLDADAAERFLAIPIPGDDSPADMLNALRQKQNVLQDFIDDPTFFPRPPDGQTQT